MRILLLAAVASVALPMYAEAGCVTGAIVGGAAGHLAGHGVLGAGAGCVVAHEHDKHAKQQAAQQANSAKPQPNAAGSGSGQNNDSN